MAGINGFGHDSSCGLNYPVYFRNQKTNINEKSDVPKAEDTQKYNPNPKFGKTGKTFLG